MNKSKIKTQKQFKITKLMIINIIFKKFVKKNNRGVQFKIKYKIKIKLNKSKILINFLILITIKIILIMRLCKVNIIIKI